MPTRKTAIKSKSGWTGRYDVGRGRSFCLVLEGVEGAGGRMNARAGFHKLDKMVHSV